MGRRPVGTGPKREGGIGGLVAYHSDEEEEEEEDEEALGGAAAAASGKSDRMKVAAAEGGDAREDREEEEEEEEEAEVDEEEAERRRVQQAAAEAEDLFKSLETEMQTTGSSRPSHPEGGATATPPLASATAEAAAAAARPPEPPQVVVPPVEVPRLSPQELKKLTAGKPAAEAEALRAQLQEVLAFVDEAQGMSARWRAEAIRVAARVQDWREGLLPSSSLVRRAKEACTARDAEIAAEEEAAAAAAAAAAEESKEEQENAGTAGAAALAAPLPPIVEAPPLPPPPPPPAEPEPAQEPELMAVVGPETGKQEEGDKRHWAAMWDSTYEATYWYNSKTGETTWEMPAGVKPSPAPAAPAPTAAAAAAAEGAATSASSNGGSAGGRDIASPVPVTGVGGDALLLYNGERPFVQTAEAVIRLFAGAGPRQVRDLGAGYFCVVFANPGGGAKGIRVAATGRDKDEEIRRAAANWVEGARGTSMRFVLPQDEPDRLTLVPVAATEEGVDEEYEYDFGTGPTAAAAAAVVAEPAVVKKGKVVVSSVVAAAPAMRRKRPAAAAAVEDGGGGKDGAGSEAEGKRQNL